MLDEQGVSDDDRSTLFSFLTRGASQGYAPQSGEIIGILKQVDGTKCQKILRPPKRRKRIARPTTFGTHKTDPAW